MTATDHEAGEQKWMDGNRAAWLAMLGKCLRELGYEGQTKESLILERGATIAALRSICEDHGDNDWKDDLHLADVIEKHLGKHLDDRD